MKIDLVYELEMPKPWGPNAEYNCYWEAMEQIEAADRYGFDTVWAVEHHFTVEYSHSSAPEVFLSAVAQRTKISKIRRGDRKSLCPNSFVRSSRKLIFALELVNYVLAGVKDSCALDRRC